MTNLMNSLYVDLEGVPKPTPPLYWERTEPIARNLGRIQFFIDEYTPLLPEGVLIDEAAVMVPDLYHRRMMDGYLRDEGWERFNEARDLVYTNPFGTRYFVMYRFYRHPRVPYRIELMMPTMGYNDGHTGFSPLHQALWSPNGKVDALPLHTQYPIPHLSFKPKRRQLPTVSDQPYLQTWQGAFGEAVDWLKSHQCIHAMTCQSTYGVFGYYIKNEIAKQVYIKPRVNLRDDDVNHAMCTVDNHDGCIADRPKAFPNPPRDGRGFIRGEERA